MENLKPITPQFQPNGLKQWIQKQESLIESVVLLQAQTTALLREIVLKQSKQSELLESISKKLIAMEKN